MAAPLSLPTRADLRSTWQLAAPIVVVQVGWQLMGAVDALMVGHVSPQALAAVSIGNLVFFNVIVIAFGILMALDPIVSQAVGAGDDEGVALGVQRGVVLAAATSVVIGAVLWPSEAILRFLRQPDDVVPLAAAWLRWSILGSSRSISSPWGARRCRHSSGCARWWWRRSWRTSPTRA